VLYHFASHSIGYDAASAVKKVRRGAADGIAPTTPKSANQCGAIT
jgi:hypothetical protein